MKNHLTQRIGALDGLRGLAAFGVVVSHLVAGFVPALYFGGAAAGAWQDEVSRSPLFVFYNGSFFVHIFFVMSGYVIAQSVAHSRSPLALLTGKRYLRL